jgi:hypothetical protein
MQEIWVTKDGSEWEFSEQMAQVHNPTVFHLLKVASKTFQLPENDAYVRLKFKNENVSNRKKLSELIVDTNEALEFELVHLQPDPTQLKQLAPTKFISPLDFQGKTLDSFNDESMRVNIHSSQSNHPILIPEDL